MLNWMGGYRATEALGPIVDFEKLSASFNRTHASCAERPAVAGMSASERFMGEEQ